MKKLLVVCGICIATSLYAGVINVDGLAGSDGLHLFQNQPNPFNRSTDFFLATKDAAEVTIAVTDLSGKVQLVYHSSFESGIHRLRITLKTHGIYALGAHQGDKNSSIILLCNQGGSTNQIEYVEFVEAIDESVWQVLLNPNKDEGFEGYSAIQSAKNNPENVDEPFRVALSLSPFSLNQFEDGYTFVVGDKVAKTPAELQQIYRELGSTEMYVRIATKRHKTSENTTDGKPDENANVHTFDQALQLCKIAAQLDIPINPEVMCAYTYMDMDGIQAPRFEEYPQIYALQHGKKWSQLSLDEICAILEVYGEFVADSILATGCTVNNWNLGNEANFGFAGVGMGVKTAVDKKLGKASAMKRYTASLFSIWWLKKHLWKYNAKQFAALKQGILKAYAKAGKDASKVRFSTHIATVVFTPRCCASYFRCIAKHGYAVETAGISYYPSAPAMAANKKKLLTNTITRINKKCDVPVFIGEFSYPSGSMSGTFAGWNKQLRHYPKSEQGQADIYSDVVAWGKTHGMAGIRYWAPDYEGWYSMAMFNFSNKVGTAKPILINHKELIK